ncbi:alpha/beta hydrolase family protein [Mucilaginibacter sp. UYCu711]|uniref:alpha/beta hydrolase family protein n=1 Tax=Mucilaginibacter sp. UYCu711 TaxID=3156339 RepID=UPI003D23C63A
MKKNGYFFGCFFIVVFSLVGCVKHTDDSPKHELAGQEFFVSATLSESLTKTQLMELATLKGLGGYMPLIQYDVNFYNFIYYTTYKGSRVKASGLLGIPKNMTKAPALLSAQHGTIFNDRDAPSNFPLAFTGFELFASAGFVTAIPDLIGYGISKDIVHPYYDMQSSASAVVDMLKAAKYFLQTKAVEVNSKVFLVGYSEGGYVSMAAQREIETNTGDNLTVTAAAEGAGGYDVTGILGKLATISTYANSSFLALFIQAYNTTYNYNRPLSDFFTASYATKIPQLLDGSKNGYQINTELNTTPSLLFNPTFYDSLSNLASEPIFKANVAANSFPNWYPISPTRLYHGTADQDVFFETSQSTYDKFIKAGANKLSLLPIPGGTHETSVVPMMLDALSWFKSLSL